MSEPFTAAEKAIADHIVEAWNGFVKLRVSHPDHVKDFRDAIHRLQSVLEHRILQRDYPETFPTYCENGMEVSEQSAKRTLGAVKK